MTRDGDPDYDEQGRPTASVDPVLPDDEPQPRHSDERAAVLRGVLELVEQGRTPRARLLRIEVLAALLGADKDAESIARRLKCSRRRVEQVFHEMRNFAFFPRSEPRQFRKPRICI
jgi:transcriptional regulator GlxA family with amidase domain